MSFNTYGDFVYVLNENDDGTLVTERRSIQTGPERSDLVEIESGLAAGERIVATGLLRLSAGQRVQIADEDDRPGATVEGNGSDSGQGGG